MALHSVTYPKSAALIFRIVVLQRRLLTAVAKPGVQSAHIDVAWLEKVWDCQDPEWVQKFCLGGKDSVLPHLKTIAGASPIARRALLTEFNRQNRVRKMLDGGGDFQELASLPGFTPALATSVKKLFGRFYQRLSHKKADKWVGYEFGKRCLSNREYKEHFTAREPVMTVCPYCDGSINTADLDHYFAKSRYPLLACSPWNLIPICKSCNDHITAKGDQPALSPGPPPSTDDWLHPFFRPASTCVSIQLTGTPRDSIPRLHAADAAEQRRVDNHFDLINQAKLSTPSLSLSKRWTTEASGYFDRLVARATRKGAFTRASFKPLIEVELDEQIASRGKAALAMIKAAVCQAILQGRPEYENEFVDSNPVKLI